MYPHWQEKTIRVNDLDMHYVRTGDGSKPPLLLAHGFSDNGMCWLPVAQDLEADYDVILPDARGHGLSARIDPSVKIDASLDLASLMIALDIKNAIVGGHSMGGSTTSAMAVRFPDLVRALILEDPGWRDPAPAQPESAEKKEPQPNPWMEWIKNTPNRPVEEIMAECRRDNPTWPDIELRPWAESKQQMDIKMFTTEAVHPDWREVVKGLLCPTLLITADVEKGAIVTPAYAEFAATNPLVQVAHIAGVGHCIHRENFGAYMSIVHAFLKEVT